MNKVKGLTIIEALIAMSLTATAGIIIIKNELINQQSSESKKFANNINELLDGFDQRFLIDGYKSTNWINTKWTEKNILLLTQNELQGSNSPCKKGKWIPLSGDNTLQLVKCDLFNKINYGMLINVEMKKDNLSNIIEVIVDYKFSNEQIFKKYLKNVFDAFEIGKESIKQKETGIVSYEYIDNQTKTKISKKECIKKDINCLFRTSMVVDTKNELLNVYGSNSFIESNLTFKEKNKNKDKILECKRWRKNNENKWEELLISDCGIGIYKNDHLKNVIVSVSNGTFKAITLNKECDKYNESVPNMFDTNIIKWVCGLTTDNNEIIQVVDKTHSNSVILKDLKVKDAFLNKLKVNNLTVNNIVDAKNIKTKELNINKDAIITTGDFNELILLKDSKIKQIKSNLDQKTNKIHVTNINSNEIKIENDIYANKIITNRNIKLQDGIEKSNIAISLNSMNSPIGEFENITKKFNDFYIRLSNIEITINKIRTKNRWKKHSVSTLCIESKNINVYNIKENNQCNQLGQILNYKAIRVGTCPAYTVPGCGGAGGGTTGSGAGGNSSGIGPTTCVTIPKRPEVQLHKLICKKTIL